MAHKLINKTSVSLKKDPHSLKYTAFVQCMVRIFLEKWILISTTAVNAFRKAISNPKHQKTVPGKAEPAGGVGMVKYALKTFCYPYF